VKPAASTGLQPAGRAAPLTAQATPLAQEPQRAGGCGGVWGAARVQGQVWSVRGPSARPGSGRACAYKPEAKSRRAQRQSEGIAVLDAKARAEATKAVRHNAAAGKGPCGGHAEMAGKRAGMAGQTGPGDPVDPASSDKARQLQGQLWAAAQRAPGGQVHVTYPAGRRDALTVTCMLLAAPAQPLRAGAGSHNAARRRPRVSREREIRMHGLSGGLGSHTGLRAM